MAFKFIIIVSCVAFASAGYIHQPVQAYQYQPAPLYHEEPLIVEARHVPIIPTHTRILQQPIVKSAVAVPVPVFRQNAEPQYPPANYEFEYSVHDDETGDHKSHNEKREGDRVVGQYTVVDPDGFLRIVDYTADAQSGFNAVVRREPLNTQQIQSQVTPLFRQVAAVTPVATPIIVTKNSIPAPLKRVSFAPTIRTTYIHKK